ncbi:RIO1 family regulatory kinase/ATPase [Actinomycetospora sp. Odt1-22]|uniref:non-specific serine/threonine protein kinase n=1 Tax=Actinomycetospora termitidis TaxID=3053470 RepID=A0ABT7MF27_9PSEU|nr:RIO1 family regulatory kinase/ATPase [Actinomycetospora sp. Odt1-22]MDL5158492.1 RIO1 family regulatory kinase/ATPase [Actinomycetospora sp. Odt1-22]
MPRRRPRFDDDEPPSTRRREPEVEPDGPPTGDRWSTWAGATHGPEPHPGWLVVAEGAVDTELGVLKTGKEADVHLLERAVPDGPSCLLAAKRYRSAEHRAFHRDAAYLEGRRVRRSRETRAMANRTAFGRDLLAGQWAAAEFAALGTLHAAGLPVPYPVQYDGTEVLLEFLGAPDGTAAPRLAGCRPDADRLWDWWEQLTTALVGLARLGWTHGDLSPYNVLVDGDRLVLIDLPQVVDLVGNPHGAEVLVRDVRRIAEWFAARGAVVDPEALFHRLVAEAGLVP